MEDHEQCNTSVIHKCCCVLLCKELLNDSVCYCYSVNHSCLETYVHATSEASCFAQHAVLLLHAGGDWVHV